MLTSITIENFKGIKEPVTIPIRPLTIMFGKNSAGKSTLIHALHYAREVLLNNNPNADKTTLGGSSIDLGGFKSLVHKHQYLERTIKLKFDFEFEAQDFPEYDDGDIENNYRENDILHFLEEDLGRGLNAIRERRGKNLCAAMMEMQNAGDAPLTASIAVEIAWSETLETPLITSYKTWICKEPAAQIITTSDGRDVRWEVNATHSLTYAEDVRENVGFEKKAEPMWLGIAAAGSSYDTSIPKWNEIVYSHIDSDLPEFGLGYQTLTQMVTGPGELLIGYIDKPGIKGLRYIGPLRKTPSRNFRPFSTEISGSWADGTAAWSKLYDSGNADSIIEEAREALINLKTGYLLDLKHFREIPLESELMIGLQNGTLFDSIEDTAAEIAKYPIRERVVVVEESTGLHLSPYDIGVGISQVVPVVVASIASENQIVAIEQPELHLHPAVQAELGDMFIKSGLEKNNLFLLETHSEHLILRVLRRIRETEEGENNTSVPPIFPKDVSLIYVEPRADGTQFLSIPITAEGDLEKNVPGGFFAERAEELF